MAVVKGSDCLVFLDVAIRVFPAEATTRRAGHFEFLRKITVELGGSAGASQLGVANHHRAQDVHFLVGQVLASAFNGAGTGHEGSLLVRFNMHVLGTKADIDDGTCSDRVGTKIWGVVNPDAVRSDGLPTFKIVGIAVRVVNINGNGLDLT